jgi:hypothetical protein
MRGRTWPSFHIKLKVQGLELEVDGTRDDIPVIRQSLAQQFAGLMQPATDIVEGRASKSALNSVTESNESLQGNQRPKRKARSTKNRASGQGDAAEESAVDWRHDTTKYGSPQQSWTASDKAVWLLYVASNEAGVLELSGNRISSTFNKHFRQAGLINTGNVNRDLGRLKTSRKGEPPWVSEDTTKEPPAWFLTEAGNRAAQSLVAQALGQQSPSV